MVTQPCEYARKLNCTLSNGGLYSIWIILQSKYTYIKKPKLIIWVLSTLLVYLLLYLYISSKYHSQSLLAHLHPIQFSPEWEQG